MCGPEKLCKRLFVWKAGLVGRSRRRNSRATTTDSESGPGGEEEAAPAVFAAGELLQEPAAPRQSGDSDTRGSPVLSCPGLLLRLHHPRALARVAPPISQGGGDRPGGGASCDSASTGLRQHPDPARLVGRETRAPSSGPPANSGTGRHARDWPGSTDPPPPAWGRDGSSRPGWGWGCLARPTLHPNTDGRASTSYKTDGRT